MVINKEDIIARAEDLHVKFVRLQFTDIFGRFKNIAVTVDNLENALDGQLMFDSSAIEGVVENEEADIYLKPDPATFVVFPWRPREGAVARLICDILNPDGTTFDSCPRQALKKVLELAAGCGYSVQVGPEVEFFLFQTDERGRPTTNAHDIAGYCDLSPADLGENARRDMVLNLEDMGFHIGASHHEKAPGQHEIDLKVDAALAAADKIATFKFVVRTIAQRHGLYASFMPKPLYEVNGSGLHLNMALFKDGRNSFYDPQRPDGLSETALYFIGGVLKHIRGMTAITNPIVNSYKRLVPSDVAPVYVAWSEKSRNGVIRVLAALDQATRLEIRHPDPACNPYLALAAIIHAGLDGIANRTLPPECLDRNPFELTNPERRQLGIKRLPRNLEEALQELARDELIQEAIGPGIYAKFMAVKQREWDAFHDQVHQWEIDYYLKNY